MEITLVKDALVTFKNDGGDKFSTLQQAANCVSIKINHVTGSYMNQKLQAKINSMFSVGNTADSIISCAMRIGKMKNNPEDQLQIMWASSGNNSFFRTLSQEFKTSAMLQMKIQITDGNGFQQVSPFYNCKNIFQREHLSCIPFSMPGNPPDNLMNNWKNENGQMGQVSGKLTLNLIFKEDFLQSYFHDNASTNHCISALAKMLQNESECDTIINSASGATLKCNRAFLVASSPYFQAMFQSGMQECSTNQVDMTDLSEIEIRALLGYLYTGDVKPALADIQMAWTLLKTGNYYQIDNLVRVMREIMMVRGHEKYSVDLALEILLFAKDISGVSGSTNGTGTNQDLKDVWNDVTLKAVLVLKWYSKERPLELLESKKYKTLHEKTPQLAMKLHAKFLQCMSDEEFEQRLDATNNFMD